MRERRKVRIGERHRQVELQVLGQRIDLAGDGKRGGGVHLAVQVHRGRALLLRRQALDRAAQFLHVKVAMRLNGLVDKMERGVLQHQRAELDRELGGFRRRRGCRGRRGSWGCGRGRSSGGAIRCRLRQDRLEIRALVRADDDAGLEAAPLDLLHLQLIGLQIKVNAAHVERVPLHEFLEEHLVGGGQVGEAHFAGELQQRGAAAGRRVAHPATGVESSAGEGEAHLFVQIRLERAQVEVAHGQLHVGHGRCNLRRALHGHRAGLVQPRRQRRGDRAHCLRCSALSR